MSCMVNRTPERAREIIKHNLDWIDWHEKQIQKKKRDSHKVKHRKRIEELEDHIKQIKFEAMLMMLDIEE